jgi:hypothetical protein
MAKGDKMARIRMETLWHPARCALVAALAVAVAPCVIGAEVKYAGNWQCDPAPKISVPGFSVPASAIVDGDRVAVMRIVYKPGSMTDVAGEMTGKGSVREGRVTVDMATASGTLGGKFEGKVSATEMTLAGTEAVKLPGRGEDQRECKALLARVK